MTELPIPLAEEKLRRLSEARKTLTEEHSAGYRWLVASLLAINGGGTLALKDLNAGGGIVQSAGGAFWIGIICALATAWANQVINRKAVRILSEKELLWLAAITTGQLDADEVGKKEAEFKNIKTWHARVCSWMSVLAFSTGVFVIGFTWR